MQKTTNFGLNQWEKTDRIMMEDFNADNAKTEEALTAIWDTIPLVKLDHFTATESTSQIVFDLSKINLKEFATLRISIRSFETSVPATYVLLTVNQITTGYPNNSDSTDKYLARLSVDNATCSAEVEIDVGRYLRCINRTPITVETVTSMELLAVNSSMSTSTPSSLPAGTKVTLYGLKL